MEKIEIKNGYIKKTDTDRQDQLLYIKMSQISYIQKDMFDGKYKIGIGNNYFKLNLTEELLSEIIKPKKKETK